MRHELSPDPIIRDIAGMALVSCVASMVGTAGVTAIFLGWDFSASLSVGRFWAIAMAISFAAPLVIAPLVALPGRRLIGELRRARAELDYALSQDSLTGLLNRRGFEAAAAARLELCQLEGQPAVAIMCDVDFFKSINDRFGHDFGDSALERIASMIEASVGEREALIGRMGGEEFAIFVPDCDLAHGDRLAGAIRSACEVLPIGFGVSSNQITLSVGVAAAEGDDEAMRLLLSRADAALCQAKRDGRNRVCIAPNRKPISIAA